MDVNVGFRMTVTSFVTSLYLTASFGAVLHLSCPTTFSLTALNGITNKINISGLTAANCDYNNNLGFSFREKGSLTSTTLKICPYPPAASCENNVAANDCGCTRQDSSFYVYTFKFLANENHTGGQFSTSLCVNPKGPFDVAVDESCTYISFVNPCQDSDCGHGVCYTTGSPPVAKCNCDGTATVDGKCKHKLVAVIVGPICAVIVIVIVCVVVYKLIKN